MIICIKGAGEIASAVAWRLYRANMRKILMMECSRPLAVRRNVSFCEAVHDGRHEVENIKAILCGNVNEIERCWQKGSIPRGEKTYCNTISDKARAISGSVLEAILRVIPVSQNA